jgi:6-phospho-beta-glucosidase
MDRVQLNKYRTWREVMDLKIAVVGAGSSYTPELVERLALMNARLPVRELAFVDIWPDRMETVAGFCRRFLTHLGCNIRITTHTDRKGALEGSQFVITQVRVGGNKQRVLDEKIPLHYGIIGQETTGPGGMFKALRTIPVMLDIAHDVEAVCPDAWIINYANPTGINAEAVQRYTQANFVGLCSGGYFPRDAAVKALGVQPEQVTYDYFGLNHLNFGYNIRISGRLLTSAEFDRLAEHSSVDPGLIRLLGLFPSPYLQYFFHRSKKVKEARGKRTTRGEDVLALEEQIFSAYADPAQDTKPAALAKRGGGGYSEIALGVIDAIYNDTREVIIVNTAQQGVFLNLPADAVLELPCLVSAAGIRPLTQTEAPRTVWGLITAVKNYERLVVEAAVSGDRSIALAALVAHPLVGDYDIAQKLLDEMLQANRSFLPAFFPD